MSQDYEENSIIHGPWFHEVTEARIRSTAHGPTLDWRESSDREWYLGEDGGDSLEISILAAEVARLSSKYEYEIKDEAESKHISRSSNIGKRLQTIVAALLGGAALGHSWYGLTEPLSGWTWAILVGVLAGSIAALLTIETKS